MQKKTGIILGAILAIVALLQLSFVDYSPAEVIRKRAQGQAKDLDAQIIKLHQQAKKFSEGKLELQELRKELTATRMSYKKIEYLLEFFYPPYIKGHINGAPLLHLDPYVPQPTIKEPKGLQRLDELIFSDEAEAEKTLILKLSRFLKDDYHTLSLNFQGHPLFDQELLEAVRLEIIRVFTLGVTGFDTPGSVNALPEATAALEEMLIVMERYFEMLPESEDYLRGRSEDAFRGGIRYLKNHNDFDSFDRAQFLKKYINPMYKTVLEIHLALNYETLDEVTSYPQPWNYKSDNIFDADFLNPYFYSSISPEEDSPELYRLGELLFFDPILSQNNQMSCASCHNPQKAFADGRTKGISSTGEGTLERNTPTLIHSVYSDRFFYDLRAFKMEDQMEHVIVSSKEFSTSYLNIFRRLKQSEEYRQLFEEAYPNMKKGQAINRTTLSGALSSYVMQLKSHNSTVDKYFRGEIKQLDPKVKKGFNLFMGKAACGTCHFAPTFAGLVPPIYKENETEVLGVLEDPNAKQPKVDEDKGRLESGVLEEEAWFFEKSFKTSTVRNVALTSPYFHNGAYQTLEEVVEFYNHGGAQGLGIDLPQQTLPSDSLHLNEEEKQALVAFMMALTDTAGMTSAPTRLPKYQEAKLNNRSVGGSY